jgi:serine/threonine-protein kinase
MSISRGARFGPYEIAGAIGVGGMGEVYRARDTQLGRDVAIKALPALVTSDPGRVARFEQEARTLAALNHPNIAQIYGIERSADVTVLVLELVEGPTLAERIARGALPVDEALGIAAQIADALEAAHERGIVHRDLKPANIKLRPDGTVKVLDFGIAKALDPTVTGPGPAAVTAPALTEVGTVLGTAAYMSPEQARGRPVDQRADIWAFGCVLYEMLAGQAAFSGEDGNSTLARVLERDADFAALPTAVTPAVRRTIELCLRKDPRKRLRAIGDVRLALEGDLAGPASPPAPFARRMWPAAAALLLGAVGASAYFTSSRPHAAVNAPAIPLPVSRFVITPPANAPLASLGGLDLAFSPDGRRIAYFAQKPESGSVEIYLRDLDSLDARRMAGTELKDNGFGNMNPFFSPDGKALGLFMPDRGVMGFAVDGARPVKLLDTPVPAFVGATWLADDTLIYSSGTRMQRVSANGGGTPEPLTPDTPERFVANPVLLPGGRALLFHVFGGGDNRIDAFELGSGKEKTLIEGGANPTYVDTGHLVFARGDTLLAVPFDAAEVAVTGEAVALVQGIRHPSGGAADYTLSASGALAYVPISENSELASTVVWVDRHGQVIERAVRDRITNPRDPRLSPDGKRLLLVTGLSADGDIWNYDLTGRPPIPLALANDNAFPVWSPDGQSVAFSLGVSSQIFTIAADGRGGTPRALALRGVPQHWSAAAGLFFVNLNGIPDIFAAPTDASGETREIGASEYSELAPALSSDGRWLAYVSNRTGQDEIWVLAYPDGVPVRVSGNGGSEPVWSADGRELFYRQGDAMMAVTVQPAAEFSFAPPVQLFAGPYLQRVHQLGHSYDVAPDGRFLMFLPEDESHAAALASIVVVQNFSEELKQRVRPRAH